MFGVEIALQSIEDSWSIWYHALTKQNINDLMNEMTLSNLHFYLLKRSLKKCYHSIESSTFILELDHLLLNLMTGMKENV